MQPAFLLPGRTSAVPRPQFRAKRLAARLTFVNCFHLLQLLRSSRPPADARTARYASCFCPRATCAAPCSQARGARTVSRSQWRPFSRHLCCPPPAEAFFTRMLEERGLSDLVQCESKGAQAALLSGLRARLRTHTVSVSRHARLQCRRRPRAVCRRSGRLAGAAAARCSHGPMLRLCGASDWVCGAACRVIAAAERCILSTQADMQLFDLLLPVDKFTAAGAQQATDSCYIHIVLTPSSRCSTRRHAARDDCVRHDRPFGRLQRARADAV